MYTVYTEVLTANRSKGERMKGGRKGGYTLIDSDLYINRIIDRGKNTAGS